MTVRRELRGLLADQLRSWAVTLQGWAFRLDPDEARTGPLVAAHEDAERALGVLAPSMMRARRAVAVAQEPDSTDEQVAEAVRLTTPFRNQAHPYVLSLLERAARADRDGHAASAISLRRKAIAYDAARPTSPPDPAKRPPGLPILKSGGITPSGPAGPAPPPPPCPSDAARSARPRP